MATYRTISISFWTDSKVDDYFTPEDKYFYLYLLTNPHTNICGCYEISMKQMERETGYNTDTVKRLLQRMQDAHDVIRFCEETKEILLLHWGKYNWSASDKLKKAVLGVATHIKCEKFKNYIISNMQNTVTETVTDSVSDIDGSIGYKYHMDTVSDISADKPQKRTRFTPPTVEEVASYCKERNNSIDAQAFVDYYTANGWKVGKNQMKDWKAAVRNWERTEKQYKPSKQEKKKSMASFSADDLDALVNNF